ncbi:MAG: hypothetical protein KVP17_004590 [Porospora cf. gigantea B]|uniref:uncharacterized protein n=2 Tax=Porospora cf. gigantea B TaxID=2853592 RepID=UPI003571A2EA|nr:MAG: hypothetical protein KVP17_004590 [Porospora cf. gigantea B]
MEDGLAEATQILLRKSSEARPQLETATLKFCRKLRRLTHEVPEHIEASVLRSRKLLGRPGKTRRDRRSLKAVAEEMWGSDRFCLKARLTEMRAYQAGIRQQVRKFPVSDLLPTLVGQMPEPRHFKVFPKRLTGHAAVNNEIVSRMGQDRACHAEVVQTMIRVARRMRQWHAGSESLDVQVKTFKMALVLEEVAEAHASFQKQATDKRAAALALAAACVQSKLALDLERQRKADAARKERLRALRSNNLEEYVKMIRETKNERLVELLNQTDRYLLTITKRVQSQKKRSRQFLGGHDDDIQIHKDYYSAVHCMTEDTFQPACFVNGDLMPYQLSGLNFLVSLFNNHLSGILADEMGLGKTVQTVALIAYLREVKGVPGPHMVVVPLSTITNWINELARFCPTVRVVAYKGTKDERMAAARVVREQRFDVLLTTYDYVMREKNVLGGTYVFIIVDEGHRMKNAASKFHSTISSQQYKASNRLLLTGTPLQNSLKELWALLNFILPEVFSSAEDFNRWFDKPFDDLPPATAVEEKEALQLSEEEQFLVINRLHTVLRPFLLRRVKSEVLGDLPEKREYVIRLPLTHWQRIGYDHMVRKFTVQSEDNKAVASTNNTVMQLRKIVNHPYLFTEEYYINENLYRVSSKFEVLARMLPKLKRSGHKTLLFSQMTQLLDILGDLMSFMGLDFYRLDGSMNVDSRSESMALFNQPDDPVKFFLLSTRAGGLGLNLQAADTVILFDSDWNPHQDLQAQARAHRMGQKREVRVFRLVTQSSVEESIVRRASLKLNVDEKVIQAGQFKDNVDFAAHESHLRSVLQLNASSGNMSDTQSTCPAELNRYLARSEEEEDLFNQMDADLGIVEPTSSVSSFSASNASMPSSHPPEDLNHDLLVKAGRLMTLEEVPPSWLTAREEVEESPVERGNRASRGPKRDDLAAYESCSDAVLMRAAQAYEDGEFASLTDAIEKFSRKRRTRTSSESRKKARKT